MWRNKKNIRAYRLYFILSGSREFVKILKEFDKEGYFNEIFIGGEEMRLIEFIRKDES